MVETVIGGLVGIVGLPIIQYIKQKLGWSGPKAALLSATLALVFALIALLGAGALKFTDFTADNFSNVFLAVFGASQLGYKLLLADR